jgi:hypothetical protein
MSGRGYNYVISSFYKSEGLAVKLFVIKDTQPPSYIIADLYKPRIQHQSNNTILEKEKNSDFPIYPQNVVVLPKIAMLQHACFALLKFEVPCR